MNREARALRDRWTAELIEQADQAFGQKTIFTPFPPRALNTAQYQDLRGLRIRVPIQNIVFDHLDLTFASVEDNGQLMEVTVADCLFTGATLDANIRGTFRRCHFDGAELEGVTIYGPSTFSECSFVKADLRNAKGLALTFDRCDFSAANFGGTHFTESEFHHCTWDDARFRYASLAHSKITRTGFPSERGVQAPGSILPDVILDYVEWLDSPPLDVWPREFEKLMAARAELRHRQNLERLMKEGQAAYKAKRFDEAIERFTEAAQGGLLDALSEKMLGMARKQRHSS